MNNIQKQNQKKKRKGFTLIELIIVLAVMAIIAAIAIPNFAAVRDSSKKKADIQSCETIKRTVLTLVADDTIKPLNGKKLTFVSGDKFVIEADKVTGVTFSDEWADVKEQTAVAKALKDVKEPQLGTTTNYIVSIDGSGNVNVTSADPDVKSK
ncbi:prepilin-type N-terminal cleavage/methylation domain-containing protein [Clostridium amylolyticum]|uniref:Prepilin-type N-terminal cleavage/methylation domain-containing protein n=1 Tax=Clostridium amylolyticum TaxID=1121298 RepID=A0A1M6I837_9CLOT|nr:type II secretion system protein [Clostridium amylolyticum]SHJ30627.1 prepilin-type N-terminal cleavage/methylation domain-containing protein [Clostridium amylolyticum]